MMDLFEELKLLGVDVEEALNRLNGNEALFKKLLGTFVKTIKSYYVQPDFDCDDYIEITEKAHAIKGAAGNLSITPVYKAYTQIVDLLRAGQPEQAKKVLNQMLPVQNDIIQCIEKYMQ